MSNKMRAGHVARIRVNPKDCQSVLDLMEKTGISTRDMSFAGCVSLALSALLETARKRAILPEPDPFQFMNRMQRFQQMHPSQIAKLNMSENIYSLGDSVELPILDTPTHTPPVQRQPRSNVGAQLAEASGMTVREAQTELTELCAKKDLADDGQYTWSQQNEERFQLCYKIVYPEG